MKKDYKVILFDLDRTLWDFDKNSDLVIAQLLDRYDLYAKGIPSLEIFMEKYIEINEMLWGKLRKGTITKEGVRDARFYETCLHFGLDSSKIGKKMGADYVAECPYQTLLMPGTIELLDYLHGKYEMGIVTNGFTKTQWIKLNNTGLKKYFTGITIAEDVGVYKPKQKIFKAAMAEFDPKYKAQDYLMVGDHWQGDIGGAKQMGMDQAFLNLKDKEVKDGTCSYHFTELLALKDIL